MDRNTELLLQSLYSIDDICDDTVYEPIPTNAEGVILFYVWKLHPVDR